MFAGSGQLLLTGNMGDIMRESVSTGLSWIKSNALQLKLSNIDFKNTDIHIHVPNAAVPKDGPSAGITIIVSLLSLFKSIQIREDTAMTGEISLQGQVLPIGGLKEKSLAALKHGLKRVIIPEQNKEDLKEFPENLLKNIK
jgi:ATP-dependent Lon protease